MNKKCEAEVTAANRSLTAPQRSMLSLALRSSARDFAAGSLYGAFSVAIDRMLSPRSAPLQPAKAAAAVVHSGVEMAAFDFVDSVSYALLQPDLSSFQRWIPWTCCTAAVSTALAKAIKVPLENLERSGRCSYKNYVNEVEDNVLSSVGFNVLGGIADMYLPSPRKIGGKFVRSSVQLVAANAGAHAMSYPLFRCKYGVGAKSQLKAFLFSLPTIPLQNALFRSSRHLVNSFSKIK